MDCQTFTMKRGLIRCTHWGKCHSLGVCLCEIEPQEDGTPLPLLPLLPRRKHAAKLRWPIRRQQLIELAAKHKVITTVMLMEETRATHGTVSTWLKKLTNSGDFVRLTQAVTLGPNHAPATFAIAQGD